MPRGRKDRERAGFTLLELLVVIMIGAILGAIAIPQFRNYLDRRAVLSARDTFSMVAARARAASIERGDIVWLTVDPVENVIRVDTAAGKPPLHRMDLTGGEIRATVVAADVITVGYTPRGFADPAASSALPANVAFQVGPNTASATISPIGRIER